MAGEPTGMSEAEYCYYEEEIEAPRVHQFLEEALTLGWHGVYQENSGDGKDLGFWLSVLALSADRRKYWEAHS
jgi:hypothetical protein